MRYNPPAMIATILLSASAVCCSYLMYDSYTNPVTIKELREFQEKHFKEKKNYDPFF